MQKKANKRKKMWIKKFNHIQCVTFHKGYKWEACERGNHEPVQLHNEERMTGWNNINGGSLKSEAFKNHNVEKQVTGDILTEEY